ncbi:hypothetical protein [Accumulibacter sp.]|uniref:hypothetical protein n=1 Tax=Accumulibacter sp. TaxID=2053492 RepID=UPI00262EAFAA|nr:hypothetical protein [Accumulibacter sp.]
MNSKLILFAASTSHLAACASTGSMKSGNVTLSAVVTRSPFGAGRIEVALNDKDLSGRLASGTTLQGANPGEAFRHRRYRHSARSVVKADDDSEMFCQWKAPLYPADGSAWSTPRISVELETAIEEARMAVLVKASLIGFSVLALVGCAGHAHRLLSTKSEGVVIGSFAHEGNTEPSMTVEFEGQQYSSRGFTITRSQNFADLNKQFGGSSGQHYQRMKSGSDNERFVYSANPVLQSSDGKTMQCSLAWRSGQTPAGSCKIDNKEGLEIRSE